jgi:hypothetical protein
MMSAAGDVPRPDRGGLERAGDAIAVALAGTWVVCLVRVAAHRIFITHDSLIDYAHVWFVASRLWHGHGLPYRMPIVAHGAGVAFPYGIVPWTVAAFVRPVLGDWSVTLALVGAAAALVVLTFVAFPELRRGWWAAAVLANPALAAGLLNGQLPFLWAAAFFMGAVAAWQRDRRMLAVVLAALAQLTHAPVLVPIAAVTVALRSLGQPERRRLFGHYAISLVAAAPAVFVVLRSSVFTEASASARLIGFVDTVLPRSEFLLIPVVLAMAHRRWPRPAVGAGLAAVVAIVLAVGWGPLRMPYSWHAMGRQPDTAVADWVAGSSFRQGATYRVLGLADGRVGMYRLLQGGGRLDSDFFPESQLRRSWPDAETYSAALRDRQVDVVLIAPGYDDADQVNEVALLVSLASHRPATCAGTTVCVRPIEGGRGFLAYEIDRGPPAP